MTSGQSQVSLRSVSGQSQVSLRSLCAYFVRQTEPKILFLVALKLDFITHYIPWSGLLSLQGLSETFWDCKEPSDLRDSNLKTLTKPTHIVSPVSSCYSQNQCPHHMLSWPRSDPDPRKSKFKIKSHAFVSSVLTNGSRSLKELDHQS